jgi:hypothetical protein
MANPGPAVAGIPNTELYISTGALQRVIYPAGGVFNTGPTFGNGTLGFQYYPAIYPVTATRIDGIYNWDAASAATTATAAVVYTAIAGIYSVFQSTNTAGTTNALTLLSGASTTVSLTYASNSAGSTQLVGSAVRPVSVPLNINMAPGEYFVAFGLSTTNSSVGLSTTALAQSISLMGGITAYTAAAYAEFSNATSSNSGLQGAQGVYSAATGALPNTLPTTAINQTGSNEQLGNFGFVMRNY